MNKRVTIYDIASALGISTATVNRALTGKPKVGEETRRIVLEKAEEMGFVPNTLARSLARRPIRLAVLAYTSFPEFHGSFLKGAEETEAQLRDYNVSVDYFSLDEGPSNTPEADAFLEETLERVGASGYDGLLVCAKEAPGFEMLCEKKIPVATAVNDIEPRLRRFCVRYNGRAAGRIAAELIYRLGGKNVPVAIASGGLPGHGIHSQIADGFREQLAVTPLDLARVYCHYDNADAAYDETKRVLREIPRIGAIYVDSFNSLGVIHAIKDTGRAGEILVIASDIYDALRGFIEEGTVAATIFQNQYAQGREGLRLLFQHIADGVSVEDTILLNPQIVLRSNMNLF